jgi:geranylgeranyl reductase family protein
MGGGGGYAPDVSGNGEWDVAVVGAGPAGLTAAWVAARAGARTIVLDRAAHPRYKTCGGGLVAASSTAVADRLAVPVRDRIHAATFTRSGRLAFTRRSRRPLLGMVQREEFDHALCRAAVEAGVTVVPGIRVRAVEQDERYAYARCADGATVATRVLVGADGSAGITAGHVGVRYAQVDLGLEVELPVDPAQRRRWRGRILIDWGPLPASYGWVFPKDGSLTVGVIAARGHADATRGYLDRLLRRTGLAGLEPQHSSGHLTRCRSAGSPLHRGRVLVAGDAAGLLEPWTREGISFALRSGTWAGAAAAAAADAAGAGYQRHIAGYGRTVEARLGGEMAAGKRLHQAFARHPALLHAALVSPLGWRTFARFCRSESSFETMLRRAPLRGVVPALGRR